MSTKAGTIEVPGPPVRFRLWAAAVSVLAAAALIMSAVALTQSGRTSGRGAAVGLGAPLWDAAKLEAMEGRVLAASVGPDANALWDSGKLEAMAGRVLAGTIGADGSTTLWDAGKLEAMEGRALAG
jgi:hypothetical protein